MLKIVFAVVALVLVMCLQEGTEVGAECCLPLTGLLKCQDCSSGSPYCGVGSCNFLGCKCEGGCRQGLGCPPIKDVVAGWVNQAASIVNPSGSYPAASSENPSGSYPASNVLYPSGWYPASSILYPSESFQAGHVSRRAVLATGLEVIRQADQDGDGKLNEAEADAWLQHHNHEALVKSISSHFADVDADRNGLLELSEIDDDITTDMHNHMEDSSVMEEAVNVTDKIY